MRRKFNTNICICKFFEIYLTRVSILWTNLRCYLSGFIVRYGQNDVFSCEDSANMAVLGVLNGKINAILRI